MLELSHVSVQYHLSSREEIRAVEDVTFKIEAGETVGLVGESGCGKSTLAYALLEVLPANAQRSGEILFHGRPLAGRGDPGWRDVRWKRIAMVFQSSMNSFSPVHRIVDQLAAVHMARADSDRRTARAAAREALLSVGIPAERVASYPHEFSGGMRQRAAIALALLLDPELLIADEPTTALDVVVQDRILSLIQDWQLRGERSVVFVSHDVAVIGEVCKTVAVMYGGVLVETGRADRVFAEPSHPYTEALLACVPKLDQRKMELATLPGSPPDLSVEHPGCLFRPRCPRAFDECAVVQPDLYEVREKQTARCLLRRR